MTETWSPTPRAATHHLILIVFSIHRRLQRECDEACGGGGGGCVSCWGFNCSDVLRILPGECYCFFYWRFPLVDYSDLSNNMILRRSVRRAAESPPQYHQSSGGLMHGAVNRLRPPSGPGDVVTVQSSCIFMSGCMCTVQRNSFLQSDGTAYSQTSFCFLKFED